MELLKTLYLIQSPSRYEDEMRNFIANFVSSLGLTSRRDAKGNLYVQKGTGPVFPCLAAHMDEVHSFRERY